MLEVCRKFICVDAIQRDAESLLGVGAIMFGLLCLVALIALAIFGWVKMIEKQMPGNVPYVIAMLKRAGALVLIGLDIAWWMLSWHNWTSSPNFAGWLFISSCITLGFVGLAIWLLIDPGQQAQKPALRLARSH